MDRVRGAVGAATPKGEARRRVGRSDADEGVFYLRAHLEDVKVRRRRTGIGEEVVDESELEDAAGPERHSARPAAPTGVVWRSDGHARVHEVRVGGPVAPAKVWIVTPRHIREARAAGRKLDAPEDLGARGGNNCGCDDHHYPQDDGSHAMPSMRSADHDGIEEQAAFRRGVRETEVRALELCPDVHSGAPSAVYAGALLRIAAPGAAEPGGGGEGEPGPCSGLIRQRHV